MLRIARSTRAEVFLAGACWSLISARRWSWLFIVVVHALNSESTNLELSKLTQFSCSVTENSEFPISE